MEVQRATQELWESFSSSRSLKDMIKFCTAFNPSTNLSYPQNFFKHLLQSLTEFFQSSCKGESSLHNIAENLLPLLKVSHGLYKMNISSLDIEFLEIVKEFTKRVFYVEVCGDEDRDGLFTILLGILQMLDMIFEFKIITGSDQKFLQVVYVFYQGLMFAVLGKSVMKDMFLIQFSTEEKNIIRIIGSTGEYTDLMLLLLGNLKKVVEKISRFDDNNVGLLIGSVVGVILEQTEFVKTIEGNSGTLALKKTQQMLAIQRHLFVKNTKKDQLRKFLAVYSEQFKGLLFYALIYAVRNFGCSNSLSFKKDPSVLGLTFNLVCSVFTENAFNEDLEVVLLSILNSLLYQDIMQPLPAQIYMYILQLIRKYFKKLGLRSSRSMILNNQDAGLVNLLFNKDLFYSSSQEFIEISMKSRKNWDKNWMFLCKTPKNFEWISAAVLLNINSYFQDFTYILKIKVWLVNELHTNERFIIECINSGFLEELMKIIKPHADSSGTSDNILALLQVQSSILSMKDLFANTNPSKLARQLCDYELMSNSKYTDVLIKCIGAIIKIINSESHLIIKAYIDKLSDQYLLLKLMQTISSVISSSLNSNIIKPLCKIGLFTTLKNKLITDLPLFDPQFQLNIWTETLKIIQTMLAKNEITQQKVTQLEFDKISKVLQSKLTETNDAICENNVDTVFSILFDQSDIDMDHKIRVPQIIPLLTVMMMHNVESDKLSMARERFKMLLYDPNCLQYFAQFGCVSAAIYCFKHFEYGVIFDFFAKVMTHVIPYSILPQELEELIRLIKSADHRIKLALLQSLEQALIEAVVETKSMTLAIRPTRFFYFRNTKHLSCRLPEDKMPKKNEFSVFFWVSFTKVKQKTTVVEILDKNSNKFKVKFTENSIVVIYTDGKKKKFTARSQVDIVKKEWIFFGVSFRSQKVSKLLRLKDNVLICCGSTLMNLESTGSLCSSVGSFKSIYIGRSSRHSKVFDGRLTGLYIAGTYFTQAQYESVFKLTANYTYDFTQNSFFSWINFEKPEESISESICYYLLPHIPETAEGFIENDCDRFNGISIFESLSSIGGIKSLIPLISMQPASETVTISVIKVFLSILKCKQISSTIDLDFIHYICHIMNTLPLTLTSLELIFKLAVSLNYSPFQQNYIRLITSNRKLSEAQATEKLKYLNIFTKLLTKNFRCGKESLFMLIEFIKDMSDDSEFYMSTIFSIVPEVMDVECIKGLNLLIYFSGNTNRACVLRGLIKGLQARNLKIQVGSCLEMSLVSAVESLSENRARVETISYLIMKDFRVIENKPGEISETEIVCESIKYALSIHCDSQLLSEILRIIVENKEAILKGSKRILLEMIVSKIAEGINNPIRLFDTMIDFANKIAKVLYNSTKYPFWMIEAFKKYNECEHILSSLAVSLVVLQPKLNNYHKFRVLLREITKFNINALEIYQKSLNAIKPTLTTPLSALEFMSILEEIIPNSLDSTDKSFKAIISDLFSLGKALKILHLSTPNIQTLQAIEIKSILTSKHKKKILGPEVYLKEGGYFRLMLKFLLIAISIDSCQDYYQILQELSISSDCSTLDGKFLIYSDIFSIQATGSVNHSFFDLYLFTELLEVLYHTNDPNSMFIDFLLIFIVDFSIYNKLMSFTNEITIEDFIGFKSLLSEAPEVFYPSWRMHYPKSQRLGLPFTEANSPSSPMTSADVQTFYKIFIGRIFEKMVSFNQCMTRSDLLLDLLKSKEWIMDVHLFLLSHTSLRMNVVSISSKYYELMEIQEPEPSKAYKNNMEMWGSYQTSLDRWIKGMADAQTTMTNFIHFKYNKFMKNKKRLERIRETPMPPFKIRSNVDLKSRNVFLKSIDCEKVPQVPFPVSGEVIKSRDTFFESFHGAIESEIELVDAEEENFRVLTVECERIKVKGSYFGRLEVSDSILAFFSDGKLKPETDEYIGSALSFTRESKVCNSMWHVSEIVEVLPRRFIQRPTAIEVYMKSGRSYFFNMFSSRLQKKVMEKMSNWNDNVLVHDKITEKYFHRQFTARWKKGLLSNFEYLMALNKYTNRSIHDISQYPVFPWVVSEFDSLDLDLNNEKNYRDLSLPIGAMNESARKDAKTRYELANIDGEPDVLPFHYGSHYSSGGSATYFLLRIEPFTTQAKKIQNNSFDIADRLFHDPKSSWASCLSNNSDVKELIPEFYYLPQFLKNLNQYELGTTQSGKCVNEVRLPEWAKGSTFNFTRLQRKALESLYVSKRLNLWIDLIFGYKQQGKAALENLNVFFPASYIKTFQILAEKGPNVQGVIDEAYFFGQTPDMIFHKQHPIRQDKEPKESICALIIEKPSLDLTANYVKFESTGKILALLSMGKITIAIKVDPDQRYFIVKIKSNKITEEVELLHFNLVNFTQWPAINYWNSTMPENTLLEISSNNFSLYQERLLISGFHQDGSLKLHDLEGYLFASFFLHSGLVTSVSTTNKYILSGGLSCCIFSWDFDKEWRRYIGHKHLIKDIKGSDSFQIIVSLDVKGLILIHDIRTAECIRSFNTDYESPAKFIALSELGVFAAAITEEKKVVVYEIGGNEFWVCEDVNESVWCLKFDSLGEYLVCGSNESLYVLDVFGKKMLRKNVEGAVSDLEIINDDGDIAFVLSEDQELKVFIVSDKNPEVEPVQMYYDAANLHNFN